MNLKQLSELLGLSQTTVSRALNGFPEVSEATRRRVQEAAQKHGYRANSRARGLATGQAKVIGHLIPVHDRHEIFNPIFGDFIAGAAQTYALHGFELMLSLIEDGDAERSYREIASRGSVDGVILHTPRQDDWRISLLSELQLPFVVHGQSSDCSVAHSFVDVDNHKAITLVTEHLIALGHQRIGYIGGLDGPDFSYRRRVAFDMTLAEAGLSCDPAHRSSSEMTEASGYVAAQAMLDTAHPPTALVTSSIAQAIGARRALFDRDLRPGRDLSITTHDDMLSYLSNGTDKPVFTASQSSVREAGQLCAEILISRISKPTIDHRTIVLEPDLVIGGSTGPCPSA